MTSKSETIRNFVGKLLDENFDFSNRELKSKTFRDFCTSEQGIAAGLDYAKHATLFNDEFKVVCKQRGIDTRTFGITPRKMTDAVKSNKIDATITPKPKTTTQQPTSPNTPATPTSTPQPKTPEQQIEITIDLVKISAKTFFNIVRTKKPNWKELDESELQVLGDGWLPVFKKYLTLNSVWIPAFMSLAMVVAPRIAEEKAQKESSEEQPQKPNTPNPTNHFDKSAPFDPKSWKQQNGIPE